MMREDESVGREAGGDGRARVLFVCLGNICRSPLAEGVFLHLARARGLRAEADSCGTGDWHVGARPDHRSIEVAARRGVQLPSRARLIDPARDFREFDLIVPMDRSNLADVLRLGAPAARTRLMLSFHPAHARTTADRVPGVPDPYTEDLAAFERVLELVWASCEGLVEELAARRGG